MPCKLFSHTRTPQQIVNNYFVRAVSISKTLPNDSNTGIYYYSLAAYCDSIYMEMFENDIHQRSQDHLKKRETELNELNILSEKNQKSTTSYIIKKLLKQIKVEGQEIQKINEEADRYLLLCIENYLISLNIWDQKLEEMVLRLCSLWFSNFNNPEVNRIVGSLILRIPSDRFLIITYQLCARLVSVAPFENADFHGVLQPLVRKIIYDYPFHTLHHLTALKNGNAKDATTVSARKVILELAARKDILAIISKMDRLFKGYIELANAAIPEPKPKTKGFKIDSSSFLFKLEKERLPIITIQQNLPHPGCYTDFIGVSSFGRSYSVPGGIFSLIMRN